jgi:hypothetical protein
MKFAIEQLTPVLIPVKAGEESLFTNINSHADLNGL